MTTVISELNKDFYPNPSNNVLSELWSEYERVILKSIVTSFGLDFIVKDQYGGDVDTINSVRAAIIDPELGYKKHSHEDAYYNREPYDTKAYHSDATFRNIKKEARQNFDSLGTKIEDAYVPGERLIPRNNKTIPRNHQGQLDHVIPAEKIHNDPGRILAGLDGVELANNESNLRFTNAALNLNKSNMTVDEYLEWCKSNPDKINWNGTKGEPLPKDVENQLRREYTRAKKEYDAKLANAYYTSAEFWRDTASAATLRGIQMGIRQALGFFFVEIWVATKEELQSLPSNSGLNTMLDAVGCGIQKGSATAINKYKTIFQQFGEGFLAGAVASLTTTLSNIFFTTSKNYAKYMRQIYAAVVQAGNVLFFNPNNLLFGDRIKMTTVILSTGASVIAGSAIGEVVGKTAIAQIPEVGKIVPTFCSSLVSGLLSCTLLIFLDRSRFINRTVAALNNIPTEANNYKEIADAFEMLAAKLEKLDISAFRAETEKYQIIAEKIAISQSEEDINVLLYSAYNAFDIHIPWEGDFDEFMNDTSNHLVFM